MNKLDIANVVFNAIREQQDFADNLEYAMGEVYSTPSQRARALESMVDSFIDELADLKVKIAEVK